MESNQESLRAETDKVNSRNSINRQLIRETKDELNLLLSLFGILVFCMILSLNNVSFENTWASIKDYSLNNAIFLGLIFLFIFPRYLILKKKLFSLKTKRIYCIFSLKENTLSVCCGSDVVLIGKERPSYRCVSCCKECEILFK